MYYFKYKNNYNEKAIQHFGIAHNCSEIQLKARAHSGLANALGQKYHRFKTFEKGEGKKILDLAVKHIEISINLNPEIDASRKAMGFIYHQMSELLQDSDKVESENYRKNAIENYQKAVKLNKEHYSALNNLCNLYLEFSSSFDDKKEKNKLIDLSIDNFKQALKINATYHFAYDNLGNAYYEKGQYENAKDSYLDALIYEPEYYEAKNDYSMLFLDSNYKQNIDTAIENFKEIQNKLKNENPDRYNKLKNQFLARAKQFNVNFPADFSLD
jgi:tetratricopeptide (TPR) repeat protein